MLPLPRLSQLRGTLGELDDGLMTMQGNLRFSMGYPMDLVTTASRMNSDMILYIDEPAKRIFSPGQPRYQPGPGTRYDTELTGNRAERG